MINREEARVSGRKVLWSLQLKNFRENAKGGPGSITKGKEDGRSKSAEGKMGMIFEIGESDV